MKNDNYFISWEQYEELIVKHFGFYRKGVDEYYLRENREYIQTEWYRLEGWENRTDFELLKLFTDLRQFSGELIILTEKIFDLRLYPFRINSEDINEFIQFHNDNYGRFFYGDLIIISMENRIMWIKHHEDFYAFVDHN